MRASSLRQGFTLLELLVAMTIFALIGMGSHALLQSVLRAHEAESLHARRLAQMQKALWVITQDVMQMDTQTLAAPYRNAAERDYAGGFLRRGWPNPMELPRGDMVQVAFRLEGAQLRRYYWPERQASKRQTQRLVDGVSAFHIRTVSPRLVEVGLTAEGFGTLTRIIEVPDL